MEEEPVQPAVQWHGRAHEYQSHALLSYPCPEIQPPPEVAGFATISTLAKLTSQQHLTPESHTSDPDLTKPWSGAATGKPGVPRS